MSRSRSFQASTDSLLAFADASSPMVRTSFSYSRVVSWFNAKAPDFVAVEQAQIVISGQTRTVYALVAYKNGQPDASILKGDLPCPDMCLPPPPSGSLPTGISGVPGYNTFDQSDFSALLAHIATQQWTYLDILQAKVDQSSSINSLAACGNDGSSVRTQSADPVYVSVAAV
ncbi:MAG: hypothetical protein IT266_03410 [Saprospiraceae bacterium]|nr:hypothetical protein [Saprospiraceae bacterium]